jgi:hypothetical protein
MTNFTHIRDSIVIDKDLQTLINQANVAPGDTVALAADTKISHAQDFGLQLPGVRVVLACGDSYDANGGLIDVSGAPGGHGDPGARGQNMSNLGAEEPGGPGGAGDDGKLGHPGGSVTLIAQQVASARFIANGGRGGDGGDGGRGGNGDPGRVQHPGKFDNVRGGDGGPGRAGGRGGTGGPGGQIEVTFVSSDPTPVPVPAGGQGGHGGQGGRGGRGGIDAAVEIGERGAAGPDGTAGPAGGSIGTQVSLDIYFATLRSVLDSIPA